MDRVGGFGMFVRMLEAGNFSCVARDLGDCNNGAPRR
jgi:hypothetical protein